MSEKGDPTSVDDLYLSVRVTNALKMAGACTVDALCELSAVDLLMLPSFGKTMLQEVERKLSDHGRQLRDAGTGYRGGKEATQLAVDQAERKGELRGANRAYANAARALNLNAHVLQVAAETWGSDIAPTPANAERFMETYRLIADLIEYATPDQVEAAVKKFIARRENR